MGGGTRRTESNGRARARTLLRYWLIQLPGAALLLVALLLLRRWFDLPMWAVATVIAAWLIKDAALYPVLKHAFDPTSGPQPHSPLGRTAVAHEGLGQTGMPRRGYVQLGGELWLAELAPGAQGVAPGRRVRVVDQRGLCLVVEPVGAHPRDALTDADA